MIDLVKLQETWLAKLRSEPTLDRINMLSLRKEVIENRIDFALVTKTKRSGRMGCGAVIEMPTFVTEGGTAPGPQGAFELSIMVIEEPLLNMNAANGTLLSAEDVGMKILGIGHHWYSPLLGQFAAAKQALEAAEPPQKGQIAYRVRFAFTPPVEPTARVSRPVIATEAQGEGEPHLVTITCATDEAQIYYTVDGSFPGAGEPGAKVYEGAFEAEAETLIQAAAYLDGMAGSDLDAGVVRS